MKFSDIKNENIRDINVGEKIKIVSKYYFQNSKIALIILAALYFFAISIAIISGYDGNIILIMFFMGIILGFVLYLAYVAIYFKYVKNLGLGILVQDIEEIKRELNISKETYECPKCGCEIDKSDRYCPNCSYNFYK